MVPRVQLLIATLCLTAFQPVLAQGMQAGSMQTMTPSSAIGPEQDSLLPPEVVPIDPNTINQMQSSPAGSSAAAQSANVPGLSAPVQASNARDLRNQAFGQLLGDQTSVPAAAMKPWRAGQTPALGFSPVQSSNASPATQASPGQMSASMPPITGMPPGMMPPGIGMAPQSQLGAPNYQMANNQGSSGPGYVAQSQTLTGASQNQPVMQNTHRGGFSNKLSQFSTMGIGALCNPFMSGFLMASPFSRF